MLLFSILVLAVSAGVNASGAREEGNVMSITGRLRLVGNEPFTHLVVSTGDRKDYYLPDGLTNEYRRLIGSEVSVTGTFTKRTLELADHSKSITQYHLDDITELKAVQSSED